MSSLQLDLLCSMLDVVRRHPSDWPSPDAFDTAEPLPYRVILHHIAFAIGERLVELTHADAHALRLTPRGQRVHALLCDPETKPEMQRLVGDRTPNELSLWLEERVGIRPRGGS